MLFINTIRSGLYTVNWSMMESVTGSFVLLWLQLSCVVAYSSGPPSSVCSTLLPSHPGSPMAGNGGYLITATIPGNAAGTGYEYEANRDYTSE